MAQPLTSVIQRITQTQANQTARDMAHWRRAKQQATRIDMPRRVELVDLVTEQLYDTHLSSQMELRRDFSLAKSFAIYKGDKEDEEATKQLRENDAFGALLTILLDTPFWGHSLIEILPSNDNNFTATLIPRRHVVPQLGVILPDVYASQGFSYRNANEYGKTLIEVGDPHDLGILFDCAPSSIYMRYAMAAWSEFCEIYGIPPRILKINTDDSEALQRSARMMQQMGSASWAIIDKDEDLAFASGVSDNGDIFRSLIKMAKEDISLKICGAQLGQDTEFGNRSKEETSLELLEKKTKSDRRLVEQAMNNIILPALATLNVIPKGLSFRYLQEEDNEALWQKTVALLPYFEVDAAWIRNKFGVEITEPKQLLPSGLNATSPQTLNATQQDPFFG